MTTPRNREPKGQSTGGQFAASQNPEATVDLSAPLDKKEIVEAVQDAFDGLGFGTEYSDRFEPNDVGVALVNRSRLEITGEMEVRSGVAWTARLTVGDDTIGVEQDGRGGGNSYDDWRLETELSDRVAAGFPKLNGSEKLDDFCSVIEAVQAARLAR